MCSNESRLTGTASMHSVAGSAILTLACIFTILSVPSCGAPWRFDRYVLSAVERKFYSTLTYLTGSPSITWSTYTTAGNSIAVGVFRTCASVLAIHSVSSIGALWLIYIWKVTPLLKYCCCGHNLLNWHPDPVKPGAHWHWPVTWWHGFPTSHVHRSKQFLPK